jgi:molecular chaperone HscB
MSLLEQNYFAIFGLAPAFQIDLNALQSAYLRLQAVVHPDRLANAPAAHKRHAMQLAARVNEAKVCLEAPLSRASYLCELWGQQINAHSNTQMPGNFLMQQMQWREAIASRAQSPSPSAVVKEVEQELRLALGTMHNKLQELLQPSASPAMLSEAGQLVRQWMFLAKLEQELLGA